MKFAVFTILACLSVCYIDAANPKITIWGQVESTSLTIGSRNVKVPSFYPVKTYSFSFPEVSVTRLTKKESLLRIRKLCHLDDLFQNGLCAKMQTDFHHF